MNDKRMKLELHKVMREIKVHGTEYKLFRRKKDKYGEPLNEEPECVSIVHGLFHVSKGYITKNTQDGTVVNSKGKPMLLIAYDEALNIHEDDFCIINGNKYKIVEKNNIQEYNVIIDVSLELILDGRI